MPTLPITEATLADLQELADDFALDIAWAIDKGISTQHLAVPAPPFATAPGAMPQALIHDPGSGLHRLDLGRVLWLFLGAVGDSAWRIALVCVDAPDLQEGLVLLEPEEEPSLAISLTSTRDGFTRRWRVSEVTQEGGLSAITIRRGDAKDLDEVLARAGAQAGQDDDRLSIVEIDFKPLHSEGPLMEIHGDPLSGS